VVEVVTFQFATKPKLITSWNSKQPFDFVLHIYRNGMSCSKDPWVLETYLEWSLDDNNLPPAELYRVFSYIARQDYGKYGALSFAYNNWNRISNMFVLFLFWP